MRKINLYYLIHFTLIGLVLHSCGFIHFLSVKETRHETKLEYSNYIRRFSLDTVNSFQLFNYSLDSMRLEKFQMNLWKLSRNGNVSVDQIRLYDSLGNIVNGYEQCYGDLKRSHFLDSFPMKRIKHLNPNPKITFINDITLFANTAQREALLSKVKRKKYTFVVFYAIWTGFYANDMLKKFSKHIKNHENEINVIYVNTANYTK